MRLGRAASGVTLVEVMMSLLLVMIGLTGLFASLTASIRGSSTASRFAQAQQRGTSLIEAIRRSSQGTLQCLVATAAPSWAACEANCLTTLVDGGTAQPQACILTVGSMALVPGPPSGGAAVANQSVDRTGQQYALAYDGSAPNGPRSTFMQAIGPGLRVYDVQIVIGWNDDGTATAPQQHTLAFRTGIFK